MWGEKERNDQKGAERNKQKSHYLHRTMTQEECLIQPLMVTMVDDDAVCVCARGDS